MATVIKMPKMSDTMEEGLLVKWLKHSGDSVVPGDVLAEVETDKAVMELENYERGTLLHLAVKEGDRIAVDSVIAIVGSVGEDYQSLLEGVVEEEKVPEKAESSSSRAVEEKKGTSEEKKERFGGEKRCASGVFGDFYGGEWSFEGISFGEAYGEGEGV